MENFNSNLSRLFEKIEIIGKTTLDIYKYKLMLTISSLVAWLIFTTLVASCALMAAISFNIALADWIGRLSDSMVNGYIIVGIFYSLIIFLIYFFQAAMLTKLQNFILNKIIN